MRIEAAERAEAILRQQPGIDDPSILHRGEARRGSPSDAFARFRRAVDRRVFAWSGLPVSSVSRSRPVGTSAVAIMNFWEFRFSPLPVAGEVAKHNKSAD